MRTVAIGVENLCVPCGCRCRYCLLSYDGRPVGVDYERGKQFTEHFFGELERTRPELPRFYYIGYCMETAWRCGRKRRRTASWSGSPLWG